MITKVDKTAQINIKLSWEELERLHGQLRELLRTYDAGNGVDDVYLAREFMTDLYQSRK